MADNTPSVDDIWAILGRVAAQQEVNTTAIANLREQQAATQRIVDSNARAISANSEAIAELRVSLREEVTELVTMIGALSTSFSELLEQDRAERAALSADVRSLIAALRERFGGNGHGVE